MNNAADSAHAGPAGSGKEKLQNELMEAKDGERLDCRVKSQASDADMAMAPDGAINRPENIRG